MRVAKSAPKSAPNGRKSAPVSKKSAPKSAPTKRAATKKRASYQDYKPLHRPARALKPAGKRVAESSFSAERPTAARLSSTEQTGDTERRPSASGDPRLVVLDGLVRELRADQETGARRPETLVRLRRALSAVLSLLELYDPDGT